MNERESMVATHNTSSVDPIILAALEWATADRFRGLNNN